nr:YmdB family metallophosphoesterase [Bacillus safensis]
MPKGTAYISDVGMTGPYDGILGVDRETIIKRFKTSLPVRFEIAEEVPHDIKCSDRRN